MRLSLRLAVAVTSLALAACGDEQTGGGSESGGGAKSGYPAAAEKNFMDACRSNGGNRAFCRCTLDQIKGKLSYEEFKKEDARIQKGGTPGTALNEAATACREKAGGSS